MSGAPAPSAIVERRGRPRDRDRGEACRPRVRPRASREQSRRCTPRASPRRWRATRSTLPLVFASCMARVTSTGVAWSTGAVEPKEAWLPAASRMPVALAASTTRKVPTAVFWAPAPSAMTSVAVAPEVETEDERAARGHIGERPGGGVGGGLQRLREGGEDTVDLAVCVDVAHEQRARDEHRLRPVGGRAGCEGGEVAGSVADAGRAVASATVKEPTAVSGAPAPSAIVERRGRPRRPTPRRGVPPEGTPESVQGAVPALYAASVSEKVASDAVDLAVGVRVLHGEGDEDRRRLVDGSGRAEGGLVAGGVANAGRARGEHDAEGADRRVQGAGALGDDERCGRTRGRDRGRACRPRAHW